MKTLYFELGGGSLMVWNQASGVFCISLNNSDSLSLAGAEPMSAKKAHKVVDSLLDASPAQKLRYHDLITRAVRARKDANA